MARKRPSVDRGSKQQVKLDREAVREVLVRFARAVAAAEGVAGVIEVLAGVDEYVDQVVKAVGTC